MRMYLFGIKNRIYGLAFLVLLIIALEGGVGQYSLGLVQERLDIFATFDLPLVHSLSRLESLLVQMSNQFEKAPLADAGQGARIVNDNIVHDQLHRVQMEIDRVLTLNAHALSVIPDEVRREQLRRMATELHWILRLKKEMVELLNQSISKTAAGESSVPPDVNRNLIDGTERLEIHANELLGRAEGEMTADIFESIRQSDTSRHWLREMWLASAILGVVLAIGAVHWVMNPLETARHAARRIAMGDLNVSLEHHRVDELGEMLTAMKEMVTALGERHRVETLVWQSEKLSSLGRLAIGLAHEIVNPLASATLHLELLRDKLTPMEPTLIATVELIDHCLARVSGIARNLLTFSRSKERDALPVHLPDLIETVLVLMSNQLRKIEVVRHFVPNLPDIMGVAGKLDQLFMNLIRNAADAMPQGGMLVLTTDVEQEAVVVSIRDSGSGIAPFLRDKVLEPFFTTRQEQGGVGLGLSICQEVVNQHGATMTLEDAPEGGLMVLLRFPLDRKTAHPLLSQPAPIAS